MRWATLALNRDEWSRNWWPLEESSITSEMTFNSGFGRCFRLFLLKDSQCSSTSSQWPAHHNGVKLQYCAHLRWRHRSDSREPGFSKNYGVRIFKKVWECWPEIWDQPVVSILNHRWNPETSPRSFDTGLSSFRFARPTRRCREDVPRAYGNASLLLP